VQLSPLHNKRVQNEADGNPKSSSLGVEAASTADEAGGLPSSHVAELNDPAVRTQLKNLGLQMPPKDKLAPEALGARQKAEIAKWRSMIKAANDVKVDDSAGRRQSPNRQNGSDAGDACSEHRGQPVFFCSRSRRWAVASSALS
jgi:hypothetical protein